METEILAANQACDDAFRSEDALAMDEPWARRAPVACIHPGPARACWRIRDSP